MHPRVGIGARILFANVSLFDPHPASTKQAADYAISLIFCVEYVSWRRSRSRTTLSSESNRRMESMAHAEPCEGYLKRGMTRKNEGETRRRMKQSQSEVSKQTGHWLHNTNFFSVLAEKKRSCHALCEERPPLPPSPNACIYPGSASPVAVSEFYTAKS